jgi:energy-coupling factor transporter ATP-binding protein EcfA2
MHIQTVEVVGVGPLLNHSIELSPDGKNLILGPNECGKSTLCGAFISIVYGFSTRKEAERSHTKGGGDRFEGRAIIKSGGFTYTISRDFNSDQVIVTRKTAESDPEDIFNGDANPRSRTEEIREYQRVLREEIGFPLEGVFRNSAFVGQLDVDIELDDELRRQISGAGQADYKKARKVMSEQYYALTRDPLPGDGARRTDRRIEQLTQEISNLEFEFQKTNDDSAQLSRLRKVVEKNKSSLSEISPKSDRKRQDVGALQKYLRFAENYKGLQQQGQIQEDHQKQIHKLQERIDSLMDELNAPRFNHFKELDANNLTLLKQYLNSDAEETITRIDQKKQDEARLQTAIDDKRFNNFRDAPENTGEQLSSLRTLKGDIEKLEEEVNYQRKKVSAPERLSLWLIPVVLFVIAGGLGGVLGAMLFPSLGLISVLAGAVLFGVAAGLVGAMIVIWLRKRPGSKEPELIAAETRLEDTKNKLDAVRGRLNTVLESAGDGVTLEVLMERWESLQAHREEMENLSSERAVLEGLNILKTRDKPQLKNIFKEASSEVLKERLNAFETMTAELKVKQDTLDNLSQQENNTPHVNGDLSRQMRELLLQMSALEEHYPTFQAFRDDPSSGVERLENMNHDLSLLEDEIIILSGQVHQAEIALASFHSSSNMSLAWVEEQIDLKKEELSRCQFQRDALNLAIQTLDESIEEYQEEYLLRITLRTGEYFNLFTQGRYSGVEIGAGEAITVQARDGEIFEVALLSAGAKDQLYLAMRLAIADLLSAETQLPLILDDSFVNFDKNRLSAALEAISKISAVRQVVLLTHDAAYVDWADRVITFDE